MVKSGSRGELTILQVVLQPVDDKGWIVAECPALPRCFSQGRDQEEALLKMKEAATAWLWAEDQKALDDLPDGQMQFLLVV